MRKILVAIIFVIFSSTNAFPGPSPGVRWLMQEPLTLFDWGVFNADKDFSKEAEVNENPIKFRAEFLRKNNKSDLPPDFSFLKDLTLSSSSVHYDLAKNKLFFKTLYDASSKSLGSPIQEQKAENTSDERLLNSDICQRLLKATHKQLYNELLWDIDINIWFSHKGFKRTNRPESIEKEIKDISVLVVVVQLSGGEHFQIISCSMPLTGGPISFTRHK